MVSTGTPASAAAAAASALSRPTVVSPSDMTTMRAGACSSSSPRGRRLDGVERREDGLADGGALAQLDRVDGGDQRLAVLGGGDRHRGGAVEHDQPDVELLREVGHEGPGCLLGDLEAVRLDVARLHRQRRVERQHHGGALVADLHGPHRAGEADHQRGQRHEEQHGGGVPPPAGIAGGDHVEQLDVGEAHDVAAALASTPPARRRPWPPPRRGGTAATRRGTACPTSLCRAVRLLTAQMGEAPRAAGHPADEVGGGVAVRAQHDVVDARGTGAWRRSHPAGRGPSRRSGGGARRRRCATLALPRRSRDRRRPAGRRRGGPARGGREPRPPASRGGRHAPQPGDPPPVPGKSDTATASRGGGWPGRAGPGRRRRRGRRTSGRRPGRRGGRPPARRGAHGRGRLRHAGGTWRSRRP